MKYNLYKYILIAFVSLQFACSFDPEIENTFDEDWIYTQPAYAEGVLLNAYGNLSNLNTDDYGGDFLDAATDNAVTNNYSANSVHTLGAGDLQRDNSRIGQWQTAYDQIRNVQLFMEYGLGDHINYDITSETANELKQNNLKGEAYYLRAWWSFHLLQVFGGKTDDGQALGYPIVIDLLTEEESLDLESVKRDTYEDCATQILKDLDSAMLYLPSTYTGSDPTIGILNIGRADDQVALALKSRVTLYAASPAYQSDDVVTLDGMGQFSVVDETAYINKWKTAAINAQEAINEIGVFSSLKIADFENRVTPPEFIWRSYFTSSNLENNNYPIGDRGNAYTGPSQNLVDAFYTSNGFPIDDARSLYDPENPYLNRDPRFYINVRYNGSSFEGRTLETFVGGRESNEAYTHNTRTGYYLRKWLTSQVGLIGVETSSNQPHYNPYFRRTELFLNLAEAANEAYGPSALGDNVTQTAVDIIKSIRTGAGITDNTYVDEVAALGKDAFRVLIQRERRLELAFEHHRYFDLRRCLLPLNETVQGVNIVKNDDDTFSYETVDVEERAFNDLKYYYAPIPYDELSKSENMIDNKGW